MGTVTRDFRTMLRRLSCQQECVSHCLGEQLKAVKDTDSWCSLVSVGTLHTPPMPSDAIRSLRPASLPEHSLGSSALCSESCLHRGVSGSGPGLASGWFQKTEPHRLHMPALPTHSLISEQGRIAVPREKTVKVTVTPESFLASRHSSCSPLEMDLHLVDRYLF